MATTKISCKYQHNLATTPPVQISYSKCSRLLLGEQDEKPDLPQPEPTNEPSELGVSLLKY